MAEIAVSVICITYNHEKYIEKCLESFICQKTNFEYEVIVHDDASTDKTRDIIEKYSQKYPDIIKPIFQTENQYSKGVKITPKFVLPVVRGKYVAFCEGDDYWTDPLKLQKQYDALEENPDCYLCLHQVPFINELGKPISGSYPHSKYNSQKWTKEEFLNIYIREAFFQLTSYFVNKEKYEEYWQNRPEFAKAADVGDEPFLLYFGQLGNVYYIGEQMSRYRRNANGSWSVRVGDNKEMLLMHIEKMFIMIREFDKYTNYQYHYLCEHKLNYWHFSKALLIGDKKELRKSIYKPFWNKMTHIDALKNKIRINYPKGYNIIKNCINFLNQK